MKKQTYRVKLPELPWYWSRDEQGFVDKGQATPYKAKPIARLAAKRKGAIAVDENDNPA